MSGDLEAGVQLPSTQQLVERYGAANATVQRALGALKDEGFLRSRVGKGVYVRDRPPLTIDAQPYLAPTDSAYSYRLLDVTEVYPPVEVAQVFGLPEDGVAVARNRLLSYDGEPVEVSVLVKGGHRYELRYSGIEDSSSQRSR